MPKIVLRGLTISSILLMLVLISVFFHDLNNKRKLGKLSSDIAVELFQKDKDLAYLDKDTLSFRNENGDTREESKYIILKKNNSEYPGKNLDKYRNLQHILPKDISFFLCDELLVRKIGRGLTYVYVQNQEKIKDSGIRFKNNRDGWLLYSISNDRIYTDNCYPWNNLEDYWKRYGKATPEQIQAVIDKGKPTQ